MTLKEQVTSAFKQGGTFGLIARLNPSKWVLVKYPAGLWFRHETGYEFAVPPTAMREADKLAAALKKFNFGN